MLCRALLTSGLGRFGIGAKKAPQPHNYSTVIIFVVGGISMAELRSMADHMADAGFDAGQPQRPRFMLGGTALVSPQDICQQVFGW